MADSQVKEMRARMKKLGIICIPCIAVLAILCFMIYSVSNYYAAAYPYNSISTLPNNATTMALSMFNGYTEKVPTGVNQTTILQSIGSIRGDEELSVNSTIEDLVLAFFTVVLFSTLSIVSDRSTKNGRGRKIPWMPAVFLFALVASQYVMVADKLLFTHGTISGISLFFVDSLLTIIWFGVAIELLLGSFVRMIGAQLSKRPVNFIRAGMVFWPLILFVFLLTLLENIGLLAYNQNFRSTYAVHALGLFAFVFFFAYILYYGNLLSAIKRMHGSRTRSAFLFT